MESSIWDLNLMGRNRMSLDIRIHHLLYRTLELSLAITAARSTSNPGSSTRVANHIDFAMQEAPNLQYPGSTGAFLFFLFEFEPPVKRVSRHFS